MKIKENFMWIFLCYKLKIFNKYYHHIMNKTQNFDKNISQSKQTAMCKEFSDHCFLSINFCENCANKGKKVSNVFYCRKCYKEKHREHSDHSNNYKLKSSEFHASYRSFYEHLLERRDELFIEKLHPAYKILQAQDNNQQYIQLFEDKEFRKWLYSTEFWKYKDPKNRQSLHTNLKVLFFSKAQTSLTQKSSSHSMSESKPLINWNAAKSVKNQDFERMYQQAVKEKQKYQQQMKVVDLVIQAISSRDLSSREQTIEKIDQFLKKLGKNNKTNDLLLMVKLYLMDLHKQNYKIWKPIVDEINKNKNTKHILRFYDSHQYWQKIESSDKFESDDVIFSDNNTESYYKLTNPEDYVKILNEAIDQATPNSFPAQMLHMSRALGHLALCQYSSAMQDLAKCPPTPSTTILSTYLHQKQRQNSANIRGHSTQRQNNKQEIRELVKGIQGKGKGKEEGGEGEGQGKGKGKNYLINVVRLCKGEGMWKEIVKCCQGLDFGEFNGFLLVQMSKALLMELEIGQAEVYIQKAVQNGIDNQIVQRLNRKKKYAEARLAAKLNNYQLVSQKLKGLQDKQTASYFYSLASSFYNQEKWDEAQQNILKAIDIRKSENKSYKKYEKLLFYTYLMKKQLDKAKQLMSQMDVLTIPAKVREILAQCA